MGRDEDPMAVVDVRLRARGLGGPAHRRRLGDAADHLGQHQLADADDRGKGGRDDAGGREGVSSLTRLCGSRVEVTGRGLMRRLTALMRRFAPTCSRSGSPKPRADRARRPPAAAGARLCQRHRTAAARRPPRRRRRARRRRRPADRRDQVSLADFRADRNGATTPRIATGSISPFPTRCRARSCRTRPA